MPELKTLSEPLLMGLMLLKGAEENFAARDRTATEQQVQRVNTALPGSGG